MVLEGTDKWCCSTNGNNKSENAHMIPAWKFILNLGNKFHNKKNKKSTIYTCHPISKVSYLALTSEGLMRDANMLHYGNCKIKYFLEIDPY